MSASQAISGDEVPSLWSAAQRRSLGIVSSSWVLVDQAIVSLASFLTVAIVGRVCGPEQMGIYGLAVSIFWLVAAIPNSLVWTPYTSRAAKLTPRRRAYFAGSATAHTVLIAFSISAVLLILGLAPLPIGDANAWFGSMCLALVPFVFMMFLREHVRRINLADLRVRELLRIDLPLASLQIGLLLGLAYFGFLSAKTALFAVSAASSVALLWLHGHRNQFQFRARSVRMHWAYNQCFGNWVLLVSIAWLAGDTAYRWMVGSLRGIEALGEFTAAQSIVLAVNPFFLAISNLAKATAANTIARGGAAVLRRKATLGTIHMALGAGAACALLALLGGPAVRLVFGESFSGQGAVIASLSLGMFAHSLMIPMDAALAALQRGRAMLVAAVVRTAVIIGAGAPLIWWLGAEGVGYAIALGCFAAAVVQWFALTYKSAEPSTTFLSSIGSKDEPR